MLRLLWLQEAKVNPRCHAFGHTHVGWDTVLEGIRYVHWPLGNIKEQNGQTKNLCCKGMSQICLLEDFWPYLPLGPVINIAQKKALEWEGMQVHFRRALYPYQYSAQPIATNRTRVFSSFNPNPLFVSTFQATKHISPARMQHYGGFLLLLEDFAQWSPVQFTHWAYFYDFMEPRQAGRVGYRSGLAPGHRCFGRCEAVVLVHFCLGRNL